jgi:hypothetical protein
MRAILITGTVQEYNVSEDTAAAWAEYLQYFRSTDFSVTLRLGQTASRSFTLIVVVASVSGGRTAGCGRLSGALNAIVF